MLQRVAFEEDENESQEKRMMAFKDALATQSTPHLD